MEIIPHLLSLGWVCGSLWRGACFGSGVSRAPEGPGDLCPEPLQVLVLRTCPHREATRDTLSDRSSLQLRDGGHQFSEPPGNRGPSQPLMARCLRPQVQTTHTPPEKQQQPKVLLQASAYWGVYRV